MALRWALAFLVLLFAGPSLALDLGTASGHYVHDEDRLTFAYAVALSQDNAEGLLDHGPQVRVLLSDQAEPVSVLQGVAFPPVRAMARAGEVQGLLLEFDPADRTSLRLTVLAKPEDPAAFLTSISLSNSNGIWKALQVSDNRIEGEYRSDDEKLVFSFSALMFTDPVQADLKGEAARKSEQVRVLAARADAIGRGDLAAAQALSTRSSAATLGALPPEALKEARAAMAAMTKTLKSASRVVVRKQTAVVLLPDGGWLSLVLEGGAWKVAD